MGTKRAIGSRGSILDPEHIDRGSMQRIKWVGGQYSAHRDGLIGRLLLFGVSKGSRSEDPNPWKLRTHLPVSLAKVEFETPDAAMEQAEKVATAFLTEIGAQWKED
jgi:hypothetical protein